MKAKIISMNAAKEIEAECLIGQYGELESFETKAAAKIIEAAIAQAIRRHRAIKALRLYEEVWEQVYEHCIGFGIYNHAGKLLDHTKFNRAHEAAGAILAKRRKKS